MRTAVAIVLLAVGFGAGYLVRGLSAPREAPRSAPAPSAADLPAPPPPQERAPESVPPPVAPEPAAPESAAAGDSPAPELAPGESLESEMNAMVKSQMPMWKSIAGSHAKRQGALLAAELKLDSARAEQLAAVLAAEAARQVELSMGAFFGEGKGEPDPDMFLAMQSGIAVVTPELEAELARFLSASEIVGVRDYVAKERERQQEQLVDMQVSMLAIPDMTQDQQKRVREVFRVGDTYRKDMVRFSRLMRDPATFERILTEEGMRELLEESFRPRRETMATILTPQQMEGYRKYEDAWVQQALMGVKMFRAMRPPEPK